MKDNLIPGYRLERRIGKGGMASVYAGVQTALDRPVAVKILTNFDSTEYSERFINEGRLLARLLHTNIITIYDVGISEGLHYIAMELVEGGDLRAKISAGMSPDTAVDWVRSIASALAYAHQRGIVHRDVKPENIMFRQDGTVLLTDFGIAKSIIKEKDVTMVGTILGSPHYMSPEQAQAQRVDGRTDIYSLGILFYEMIVGKRPFDSDSDLGIMMNHMREPLPRLPASLSRYQQLLDHMTAKRPEDRFVNAVALLDALDLMALPGADATYVATAPDNVVETREHNDRDAGIKRAGARQAMISASLSLRNPAPWICAAVIGLAIAGFAIPSLTPSLGTSAVDAETPTVRSQAGPASISNDTTNTEAPLTSVDGARAPAISSDDDSQGVFELAMAYRNGQGVPPDDHEAARLLRLAAEQRHPQAQYYFGLMIGQGRGDRQDFREAVRWYQLAARQGVADAQHLLCLSYALGRGIKKDRAMGYAWCEIARDNGSTENADAVTALRRELSTRELRAVDSIKTALEKEIALSPMVKNVAAGASSPAGR